MMEQDKRVDVEEAMSKALCSQNQSLEEFFRFSQAHAS